MYRSSFVYLLYRNASVTSLFENVFQEIRGTSIARQVEIIELEATLKQAVENLNSEINNIKQMKMNVSASETSLDNKIEKKRIELDRNQKRLQTLKKVRYVSFS